MSLLSELITRKLIPQLGDSVAEHFIVGRSRMHASQMPPGVELISHKITGKRVLVKGDRFYNNTRGITAVWPEMKLNEMSKLKMIYVVDGYLDYQLGNYRVKCGPGNCIAIAPGVPHPDGMRSYLDSEKSTFAQVLFFMLHPNALECWISGLKVGKRKEHNGYLILNQHLTMLFQVLMEELISGGHASYQTCAHLFVGFASILLEEANSGMAQPMAGEIDERINRHGEFSSSFATKLEDYIQVNLHENLKLENVARDMFFSRAQFTRVVRRETGKSFNELVLEYRMAKAKSLLLESDWTIFAISRFVGFNSPSYFNTIFKRHEGKTPTSFRLQHQKHA